MASGCGCVHGLLLLILLLILLLLLLLLLLQCVHLMLQLL
jgi:hypothetical protein